MSIALHSRLLWLHGQRTIRYTDQYQSHHQHITSITAQSLNAAKWSLISLLDSFGKRFNGSPRRPITISRSASECIIGVFSAFNCLFYRRTWHILINFHHIPCPAERTRWAQLIITALWLPIIAAWGSIELVGQTVDLLELYWRHIKASICHRLTRNGRVIIIVSEASDFTCAQVHLSILFARMPASLMQIWVFLA